MTNKLTSELIQDIYEEAVSAECFERKNVDSACFDLLCKMDEAGGLSHVVRVLIDMARAPRAEITTGGYDLNGWVERLCDEYERQAKLNGFTVDTASSMVRALFLSDITPALRDVATERQRQITAEGWTPEHDDEYEHGELADAAGCYALHSEIFDCAGEPPRPWPWPDEWWKPTNRRRDLVKAGALILAEIERIDRQEQAPHEQ